MKHIGFAVLCAAALFGCGSATTNYSSQVVFCCVGGNYYSCAQATSIEQCSTMCALDTSRNYACR
jgi:hypothetical protein